MTRAWWNGTAMLSAVIALAGFALGIMGGNAWVAIGIACLALAYWAPTLIAHKRRVRNVGQVAIVNGLLGFVFVGWVVALVMAAKPADAR